MKKTDQNIIIAIIIGAVGVTTWTLVQYASSTEKTEEQNTPPTETATEQSRQQQKRQETMPVPEKIIPEISPSALSQKMDAEDITIIDTRPAAAHEKGHIRGSVALENVDFSTTHRTIVFVTSSGNEDLLMGYYRDLAKTKTVYNLSGGIAQWQNDGRPLLSLMTTPTFATSGKVHFVEPRDVDDALRDSTRAKDLVVIDVRRSGNYAKGHIPTAINIPLTEIEMRYKEIPRTKKIYIYNTDENTSFYAGVLLYDLGYMNTKTIKGGFDAWQKYGYPVTQ